jgi:hypothetical protein
MADENKLKKLIEERFKLIENSPKLVIDSAEREQERLLKELIAELDKLDTKDGVIVLSDKNISIVDDITKKIKKSFYKSDYIDSVDEMIKDLDKVKGLTKDFMTQAFGKFDSKKPDILFTSKKVQIADALFGTSSIQTALFAPINNVLLNGVQEQSSFSEVYQNLLKTVTGDDKTDGKLKAYARTIATTTMSTAASGYTQAVSDLFNIQWYRYVGGLVPDSRCFCEERNNKYFHINEILSWGRMENLGDCNTGNGWAGMIAGTNESNIRTNKGGWNCNHDFIPVSISAVPMDVIQEAIQKWGFVPSEAEKELLGL